MWLFFALLSAFFLSFKRVFEKSLTQKLNYFSLSWVLPLFSLPVIGIIFLVSPAHTISNPFQFWVSLGIIWFILYPIQSYSYYHALTTGAMSDVLPILSFIPVFNLFISWILIGEIPSFIGLLGIVFTVVGLYVLQLKSEKKWLPHFENQASLYMLISAFSSAIGFTLDKVAIKASHVPFYTFINVLGATIVLFTIAAYTKNIQVQIIKNNIKRIMYVGFLQSVSYSLYTAALGIGVTAYVVSIRNSNLFMASIIGIYFFKEPFTHKKKIAYLLIFLGLLFLSAR